MANKLNFRELGMDTMERLYYERQSTRQKAYVAKRKKSTRTKERPAKEIRIEQDFDAFRKSLKKAI